MSFFKGARAFVCLVLVTAIAVGLLSGVTLSEMVLFAGYELVFVIVPGVVLHALLGGAGKPWLDRLAIGWALGLAIELGMFALTASLDLRGLLPLYPLPFFVVAARKLRQQRSASGGSTARAWSGWVPDGTAWLAAAVATAALVSLGVGVFASNPLPRDVESAALSQDLVFNLSLVAEAKHHWPLQDPSVAGEQLHYHTFANYDMAAISQVTGIAPDVVLFRLWPIAILLAIALLVAGVARNLGASRKTAVLAVALALLAGELDVDTRELSPFLGSSLIAKFESPSALLGAVFFMAALYVLIDRLRRFSGAGEDDAPASRGPRSSLVMLGVIILGASGAKASVIPVIAGGLALYLVVGLLRHRALDRDALSALGVGLAGFAVSYVVLYAGGGDGGFSVKPLEFAHSIVAGLPDVPTDALGIGGLPLLLAPMLGFAGVLVAKGRHLARADVLILCMLAASFVPFLTLSQPGLSQGYFLLYGYLAAIPLSALGAQLMWNRLPGPRQRFVRRLAWGVGVMATASLLGALVLRTFDPPSPVAALAVAYGLLATAAATGTVIARRTATHGRRVIALAIAIPLTLFVAFLDFPIDTGGRLIPRWSKGEHAWSQADPGTDNGLTHDLRDGLLWVRDNSPTSAVFAVNNFLTFRGTSRYFYYTAFAERRSYLESWGYTQAGLAMLEGRGKLPPWMVRRARMSYLAALGHHEALDALKRDGVALLVLDKVQGQYGAPDVLDGMLAPVFSNDAVAVYDLSKLS